MAAISRRTQTRDTYIWPGFVDALATLLMVIIFVLMIFIVAQFHLTQLLSGQDSALTRLQRQVLELSELLALEREAGAELRLNITELSSELQASMAERDIMLADLNVMSAEVARAKATQSDLEAAGLAARKSLQANQETIALQVRDLEAARANLTALNAKLAAEQGRTGQLKSEKAEALRLSEEAQRQVAILNRQMLALRQQLAAIQEALDAAEAKNIAQNVKILDLGRKLNRALASKVQELARFRSEFFGRLGEVLQNREDVRVVGDRFVFQSEVLFASGSAEITETGYQELTTLAAALNEITPKIPDTINWILQVEGHTDRAPIATDRFPSNWHLSTARAISVVDFLIASGVPPDRLSATGYGEYQPIEARGGAGGEARGKETRNPRDRRIELKLTQR